MKIPLFQFLAMAFSLLALTLTSSPRLLAQSFETTGNMTTARARYTATFFVDGVLIAGGSSSSGTHAEAEVYDPDSGIFNPTTPMTTARKNAAAALLNNGMVLIVGGENGNGAHSSGDVFNPSNFEFAETAGLMSTPRTNLTATTLNDGTVLVVGGANGNTVLDTAEIYNPTTGKFTLTTGNLGIAIECQTATLLINGSGGNGGNGSVLITGGQNSTAGAAVTNAWVYNPSTQIFTLVGGMHFARTHHTATLLSNGMVLIAGGENTSPQGILSFAEVYNPANGTTTVTDTCEIFNPTTSKFTATASMNTPRELFTMALLGLQGGNVLVPGGFTGSNYLSIAEIFVP
jgi:hypothetical protein